MDKIVSVVVTCYNHDKYIEECLRSVFKQTYRQIKLLVFNDGSTDGSESVIQSVLKDSPFEDTEYFYHDNQGIVRTRNRALEMVDSDFVLFVDSDNALEPNYVEALLAVAEEQNADIVYTTFKNLETQEVLLPAQEFQLERLYAENFIESCSLIRVSVIEGRRYDDFLNHKRLEDYDFFLNLIVNGNAKAIPCFETFLHYRVLENSRSSRSDIIKYYEVYAYILGKYFEKHKSFAHAALQKTIRRLHDLLVQPLSQYQVSLFYDRGSGFSESDKRIWDLNVEDSISFSLDSDVVAIRIDLGELPTYFKKMALVTAEGLVLEPKWTNGFKEEEAYFFTIKDPQLIYDVSGVTSSTYHLTYEMFHLYSEQESSRLNQHLTDRMQEMTLAILEMEQIKEQYRTTHQMLEETRRQLANLENQYAMVIGSRRWRIPTKLINFFRRKK